MTHTFLNRRSILAAASLALPGLALLSNTVRAQEAQPEAGPFRFKAGNGEEVDAERGFFEVPEDRRIPGSRRIRIGYVRFASTSKDPGPPIIYLAGGPGGSGPRTAMGPRFPIFMALREVADVIALDQRGVGLSSHIPDRASTTPFPAMTHAGVTAWYREEMQKAWIDWTRAGVAMTGYNTEQNADDIEDLRRHLGVEKVNLWGIQLRHPPGSFSAEAPPEFDRSRRHGQPGRSGSDHQTSSPHRPVPGPRGSSDGARPGCPRGDPEHAGPDASRTRTA
nr:alpha/beta fold hydrolase [Brevundimonas diminuta]